jgi:hypothetical protein
MVIAFRFRVRWSSDSVGLITSEVEAHQVRAELACA